MVHISIIYFGPLLSLIEHLRYLDFSHKLVYNLVIVYIINKSSFPVSLILFGSCFKSFATSRNEHLKRRNALLGIIMTSLGISILTES
jgi:uncharacterized BrkB/YihY/UPF0761 family membrane protein